MIDLELLRMTIVDCCTNANGSTPYSIQNKLVEMRYPSQIVFNQLVEYKKLNLFDRAGHETDGGFYVFGLSKKVMSYMVKSTQTRSGKIIKKNLQNQNQNYWKN